MSNVNVNNKAGHPVIGILLGIAGIAVAFLMTLLFGVAAGAVAGILGIGAALLGILARRNGGRGMGAIVAGALAIVLAFTMTVASVNTLKTMKNIAETSGVAPTFAKYMENPYTGIAGIAANAAKSGDTDEVVKTIQKEMDDLNAYMSKKDGAKTEQTADSKEATTGFAVETKTGVGVSLSIGG
ncbi:MAG: DUF308 domain-containing protein [Clostridia bacterium]|nr:DUF308 domain-containing protein [Clostridia bacterium]